jgi:hypothetical protein
MCVKYEESENLTGYKSLSLDIPANAYGQPILKFNCSEN